MPKVIIGSRLLDGSPPSWPDDSVVVTNAEEARKQVNALYDKGADFIKVYEYLSREAYLSIADEAKKLGIPFVGHVPQAFQLQKHQMQARKALNI